MKKKLLGIIVSSLLISAAPSAHAISVSSVVNGVVNGLMSKLTQTFMPFLSQNFSAMTQGIQAEVNKSAIAQKNTIEAVATYEAEERLRRDAVELSEKLEQPSSTCQTMATADASGKADANARLHTATSLATRFDGRQRADGSKSPSLLGTPSVARSLMESHNYSTRNFGPDSRFKHGDVNANFLFANADDKVSETYAPGQEEVAAAFIDRVVNGSTPPEKLRDPNWEKTDQGRAYVEMVKDYAAIKSLSALSLESIKGSYVPQAGLGRDTGMAQYLNGRQDISMMDAIGAFVKMKFSPQSIADMAEARNPNKILRDMAMTNSYRLWIEHNNLRRTQMSEALLAAQLSMTADQYLKPQINAQRINASKAAIATGG